MAANRAVFAISPATLGQSMLSWRVDCGPAPSAQWVDESRASGFHCGGMAALATIKRPHSGAKCTILVWARCNGFLNQSSIAGTSNELCSFTATPRVALRGVVVKRSERVAHSDGLSSAFVRRSSIIPWRCFRVRFWRAAPCDLVRLPSAMNTEHRSS